MAFLSASPFQRKEGEVTNEQASHEISAYLAERQKAAMAGDWHRVRLVEEQLGLLNAEFTPLDVPAAEAQPNPSTEDVQKPVQRAQTRPAQRRTERR